MSILSIQWGTARRSIALQRENGANPICFSFAIKEDVRLAHKIHELLLEADEIPTSINRIIVNRGPGSYTGIRIALATIQGICAASDSNDLTVTTVDTHDAILIKLNQASDITNMNGSCIASYAQRGEVVVNMVTGGSQNGPIKLDSDRELMPTDALCERISKTNGIIFGCDLEKWIPKNLLRNLTLDATDLINCEGNNYSKENFHTVEPYYVRPQEFVKAPAARFRAC